jgi:hypothetical protein
MPQTHRWLRAVLLAAVCTTAQSLAGCGAAGDTEVEGDEDLDSAEAAAANFAVGISDSDPETFTHPAWSELNVKRARVVVPYDVAQRPASDARRQQFETWLATAQGAGVEPYVTLGPSALHEGKGGRYLAPSAGAYESAFVAFRQAWPSIELVGAWNEPNFPNSVLKSGVPLERATCKTETLARCGPMLAAFYWRLANKHCPGCTVVAGEFTGAPSSAYWGAYKKYLRDHRPKVWSVHPHNDANRFQAGGHHCQKGDAKCTTRSFVKWLNGLGPSFADAHVWLTEVGAYRRNADGHVFSEKSQRDAVAFILRLPQMSSRITRIYYYNLQNACGAHSCPVQDRGLIAPMPGEPGLVDYDKPGKKRGAFGVIRDRD